MISPAAFASAQSPTDLMAFARVEPPSEAIATILDAIWGCSPTAEQAKLWPLLSTQPWPRRRKYWAVVAIGRRGLKTTGVAGWSAPFAAIDPRHDAHALAGSRIYVLVVAPKLDQARESMRAIKGALDALAPIGVKYSVRDEAGSPEIVLETPWLKTQRVIRVQTADAVSVRGFAVCFAIVDEAGFLGSSEWLAETDRDLLRALSAGQAQFPDSGLLLVSSCGPPQGEFFRLVTKPPADTLVVKCSTWISNPRISEDDCRRIAGGDDDAFEQEFASRRWGYSGESYIDAAAVRACFDEVRAGRGPRPGAFVVALDVGQVHDSTAILVASSYAQETRPGEFIRHVCVDHLELIPSSKKSPTPLETIVDRVVAISKQYSRAAVVFDPFVGVTVEQMLEKRGMRAAPDAEHLRPGRFLKQGMAAQLQTPRWKLVRDLTLGRRLHLHPQHEALAKQLSQLRATQLSSGALKIEGRRDDAADVLALACEIAVTLPSTGGDSGDVTFKHDGMQYIRYGGGLRYINPRFVRTLPNGRQVPAAPPEWDPQFGTYAKGMIEQGYSTEAIERWRKANEKE